ncbi:MAG: transposase [bacterium]|nr:transposase [bacterium]
MDEFTNRFPERRSTRLKEYDYSQAGGYFITICTYNRECIFGDINDGEMHLNEFGRVVKKEWVKSQKIRREIQLDEYTIMPNHFHAILHIENSTDENDSIRANRRSPLRVDTVKMEKKSLSSLVAGFKSNVTIYINKIRQTPGMHVWQRNFYEHVIRDEEDLNKIRQYILDNPQKWEQDNYFRDDKSI